MNDNSVVVVEICFLYFVVCLGKRVSCMEFDVLVLDVVGVAVVIAVVLNG